MAKTKDDDKILQDGERVRVPLTMMDSVQRAIHDASHPHSSHHKPGYRFATDSDAKQRVNDAHAEYDREISERYKHTNPEPPNTPAAPVIDSDFDDEGGDCYSQYDARIRDAWRSK